MNKAIMILVIVISLVMSGCVTPKVNESLTEQSYSDEESVPEMVPLIPTPVPTYTPLRDASSTPDIDSIEGVMYSDGTMELHIRCSLKVGDSECYLEGVTIQISGSDDEGNRVFNYQNSSFAVDAIRDIDNSISEFGVLNRGDLTKIRISEIYSSVRECELVFLYMLVDGGKVASIEIVLPDGFIHYDEFFDVYP